MPESTHGDYLMLLQLTGVSDEAVDRRARSIHSRYMQRYGPAGAMTVFHLRLGRAEPEGTNLEKPIAWDYALRFFGPKESLGWLQEELVATFREEKAEIRTQSARVDDLTGRY